MKTSVLLALVGVTLHFASAAVRFPYTKQQRPKTASTGSIRRSVNASLSYIDATYVVNVTVGTPGQAVALELSTSSADTWVMDARSPWCTYTDYGYDNEGNLYATNVTTYCIWGSCKYISRFTHTLALGMQCLNLVGEAMLNRRDSLTRELVQLRFDSHKQ